MPAPLRITWDGPAAVRVALLRQGATVRLRLGEQRSSAELVREQSWGKPVFRALVTRRAASPGIVGRLPR